MLVGSSRWIRVGCFCWPVGKKMDFLLQEMNREANTMLSKTSGLAGEALKVTEMGLLMKSDIEKSREQVQNLE